MQNNRLVNAIHIAWILGVVRGIIITDSIFMVESEERWQDLLRAFLPHRFLDVGISNPLVISCGGLSSAELNSLYGCIEWSM